MQWGRLTCACSVFILLACSPKSSVSSGNLIGFALADLDGRQKDRDRFVAVAESLGAQVIVQNAGGEHATQLKQCADMLERDIKLLVIEPADPVEAASIVEQAHEKNVKVICYDYMIDMAPVDLCVSFDRVKAGEMQAQSVFQHAPQGNYLILLGDADDKPAGRLHQGHMNVLRDAIYAGRITIADKAECPHWSGDSAHVIAQTALSKGKIDAVIASNDALAAGAIAALEAQGVAGTVPVSGMNASARNCRYIEAGKQLMSVLPPVERMAARAARLAVTLANGGVVDEVDTQVFNGSEEVPVILLQPSAVTKENLKQHVIAAGSYEKEEF
ncbi:MAG: substrate-binding domain-containing protein [Chitinivibrionales bacterium]|nr:substrate-binding domain-containing protein [Chitinivibrionales bacterium]